MFLDIRLFTVFCFVEYVTSKSAPSAHDISRIVKRSYIDGDTYPGCDGTVHQISDSAGIITSPGYPAPYPHGVECKYLILGTSGEVLSLRFAHMAIEETDCADSISIYDGTSASATRMSQHCQLTTPSDAQVTTGQSAFVLFKSDSQYTSLGFALVYSLGSDTPCQSTDYYSVPGETGSLTSPMYPFSYPSNERCLWRIQASDSSSNVKLTIDSFQLEEAEECTKDVLLIQDGYNDIRLCATQYQGTSMYSAGSSFLIQFDSSSSISGNGFKIEYEIVDLCESPKTITASSGKLGSPGFSFNGVGSYVSNAGCSWKFEAGSGQIVLLRFTRLDIEPMCQGGCCDKLLIYNGPSAASTLAETICERYLMDHYVKSSGSDLFMAFTSDSNQVYNGFEFIWEFMDKDNTDTTITSNSAGCSGSAASLTGSSGTLASPLTDSNMYPVSTTCAYAITVSSGKEAVLTFNEFNLEDHRDCEFDSVKVYDGTSNSGTLLGTFCGTNEPPKVRSNSRNLYVEFDSDSSVGKSGFIASYSEVADVATTVCGVPNIEPTWENNLARIVGGSEAVAHSFPWLVSLNAKDGSGGSSASCGASIIDSSWILTAAHCTEGSSASEIEIVVGEHDQSGFETTQTTHAVAEIIEHSGYDDTTLENDIALLRLSTPITYNFATRPVCLSTTHVASGTMCVVTGWGATEATADNDYKVNQVEAEIISTSTCNQGDWLNGDIIDTNFCAGFEAAGRDTCQGDSGGPLVCESGGVYTQYGVVSYGYGCAEKKKPGVYTKVSKFVSWINSQAGLSLP